jgi:hypothetical protein
MIKTVNSVDPSLREIHEADIRMVDIDVTIRCDTTKDSDELEILS